MKATVWVYKALCVIETEGRPRSQFTFQDRPESILGLARTILPQLGVEAPTIHDVSSIKEGDRVRFASHFLESIGAPNHWYPWTGDVTEVRPHGEFDFVSIRWYHSQVPNELNVSMNIHLEKVEG